MSLATLSGVGGGGKDLTLFRKLVDRSITTVTAEDLAGVTTIGEYAFYNCLALERVTMSNSVVTVGIAAFSCSGNSRLTNVILGNSVTTLSDQSFYNCDKLQNIIITSNLVSIGRTVFRNCRKLTDIVIPSSITSIDRDAFYNCIGLTRIIIKSQNPPTLGNSTVFENTNNCPIYVPFYTTTATNWVSISSRLFPLVNTVADLSNIDTTAYTKACVVGADESYKEYTYDGSQWNEV